MPADHRNNVGNDTGDWFVPVNPNEHSYTPGYGFAPRPPHLVERRLIMGCSTAVAVCLLGFLFVESLLPRLCLELMQRLAPRVRWVPSQELLGQAALLAGSVGALTMPFALYAGFVRIPRGCAVPLRPAGAARTTAAVCCALAAAMVGGYASGALETVLSALGIRFFTPDLTLPAGRAAQVLYWLNLTVVPAVFEEIAFRGVLMQSLRRFGDGFALISSSALFALVHLAPLKMPNAFLMGLVIGYFVLFAGTVRIGIAIHFIHNTAMLLLPYLSRFNNGIGRMGIFIAQFVFLAVGLTALVALMRRHAELFSLRSVRTVNSDPQKLRSFFLTFPMAALILAVALQTAEYLL